MTGPIPGLSRTQNILWLSSNCIPSHLVSVNQGVITKEPKTCLSLRKVQDFRSSVPGTETKTKYIPDTTEPRPKHVAAFFLLPERLRTPRFLLKLSPSGPCSELCVQVPVDDSGFVISIPAKPFHIWTPAGPGNTCSGRQASRK